MNEGGSVMYEGSTWKNYIEALFFSTVLLTLLS